MNFPWTCPYCSRDATITDSNISTSQHSFHQNNKVGRLLLQTHAIVCPNDRCRNFAITAALYRAIQSPRPHLTWETEGGALGTWTLRPASSAKPLPDYIPQPIREDYEEACAILALSPKASATLARRCLQGIIHDFWKIKEDSLFEEITALQGKIDPELWTAIHGIRSVGNIGAHMGKDINMVVQIDSGEAESLVHLIELLLEESYIARHNRTERIRKVTEVAADKKQAKEKISR